MKQNELRLFIEKYAGEFGGPDEDITRLTFAAFPRNTDPKEIAVKIKILNTFYGTNIISVEKMALHIHRIPNIDGRLADGDLKIVEDIRRGHDIKRNKELDFYSFSTKSIVFVAKKLFLVAIMPS